MAPVNGTQTAKNCTDPGKRSISPLPQGMWPGGGTSVNILVGAEEGGLMKWGRVAVRHGR